MQSSNANQEITESKYTKHELLPKLDTQEGQFLIIDLQPFHTLKIIFSTLCRLKPGKCLVIRIRPRC